MRPQQSEGPQGDADRTVFILGAGFSRAISAAMPLTDELGYAALDALRSRLPPRLALDDFPSGLNFEAWLSQLAGDQPYLSDAENLQNQAAFLLFSETIANILNDRVNRVLAERYPEWLLQLVSAMHHTRSTVITFNYDPLIECMVATPTGILGDPNQYGEVWNGVSWTELSGGLPPWAPGDARFGSTRVQTLRLLKLHGSLNWYWRPGDASGVSVARRSLPGHFGEPHAYNEEDRRREVPGRSPFIVPPASSKSLYYSNAITREMWSQAAQSLARADRVVIVGYSLPPTDVTFSNMLRDGIADRELSVEVVDLDAELVCGRVRSLGIADSNVTVGASGPTAVPDFVSKWTTEQSRKSLSRVLADRGAKKLVLAWGDRVAYAPVESIEVRPASVVAVSSRVYASFNLATGINSRPALSVDEAKGLMSRTGFDEVSAFQIRVGEGPIEPIVSVEASTTAVGQGGGDWLVLQVAATPPPSH